MSVESRHRETCLEAGQSQETVALPNNPIKLLYVIRPAMLTQWFHSSKYTYDRRLYYRFVFHHPLQHASSNFVSNFSNTIAIIVFRYSANQTSMPTKTTEKDRAIRRKHEMRDNLVEAAEFRSFRKQRVSTDSAGPRTRNIHRRK